MAYLKKLFSIIILLISICLGFVFADVYNFSYIDKTAYLNFNGQVNGINYAVKIDESNIYSVTGNDSKLYQCFKAYGTGYTDTLGEVYFTYNGKFTYICADGKWRGYAKIAAGGWIEFEDSNLGDGENWQIFTNRNVDITDAGFNYSSKSGEGLGTGQALSDGLGLWIWNYAKTDFQPRQQIYNFIDIGKSTLYVESGKLANGTTKAKFNLIVKDSNGNNINGLRAQQISFYTGDSIFRYDDSSSNKSGLFFDGLKYSLDDVYMDGGIYSGGIYSILSHSGAVSLKLGFGNKSVIITSSTYFKSPLNAVFDLADGDGNGKLLMGYNEKGSISITGPVYISNIVGGGTLQYQGVGEYIVNNGKDRSGEFAFNINLLPYSEESFVDNSLGINYRLEGRYDINVSGNLFKAVPYYNLYSTTDYIYPEKIIDRISLSSDCGDVRGNGKDVCKFNVKLLNSKGYSIPNLKFSLGVDDANKSLTKKSSTFDLDETSLSYENGLHLIGYDNTTNGYGNISVNISSYKPVYSGALAFEFSSINGVGDIYSWAQPVFNGVGKGVLFDALIDFTFSGEALFNILKIGKDNSISVLFNKLNSSDDITNPSYSVKGRFESCKDCVFTKGGTISDSGFGSHNIVINFSGSNDPDYIHYDQGYVAYNLNGASGVKSVKLISRLGINNKPLKDSSGLYLLGSANMGYNMKETSKYNGKLNLFGSEDEISKSINKLRLSVANSSRSISRTELYSDSTITKLENYGLKYFQCNGGSHVILGDGVSDIKIKGDNKLILFDCPIYVKSNILKADPSAKLNIISIAEKDDIDYSSLTGWKLNSNIYVYPDVRTVFSNISTNGSLLFLTQNESPAFTNIFIKDRIYSEYLKKQIVIRGKIISRNILGGGYKVDNKFYLPGGKVFTRDQAVFGQADVKAEDISKAYDINFWRINYVNKSINKYDVNNVSDYLKTQLNCTGDMSDERMCYMPVVVENDIGN